MVWLRAPGFLPIRALLAALPAGDRSGVHRHLDPRHERRIVGAQPDDRGGDLLGRAEAAQRLRAQDLLLALGRLARHQRRHDRPRADRVHADPLVGVLDGRVLRQAADAVLARGVRAQEPNGPQAGVRRRVDDGAAARPEHVADLVLHAEERAAQVDGDDAIELGVVGLVQALVDADAGVVVGVVEAAIALDRLGDDARAVLRARHVARDEGGVAALVADRLHRLLAAGAGALEVGDDHGGALLGEADRARAADAARRARDEARPALHPPGHGGATLVVRVAPGRLGSARSVADARV